MKLLLKKFLLLYINNMVYKVAHNTVFFGIGTLKLLRPEFLQPILVDQMALSQDSLADGSTIPSTLENLPSTV